jgi:hypothetical protein
MVQNAIRHKLAQKHLSREYKYRVEKEKLEKERKRIEAEGIALFQQGIPGGISEQYLRWKALDATLALARSPNSKVVVIGGGKEGMPIILGPLDWPEASKVQGAGTGAEAEITPPDYPQSEVITRDPNESGPASQETDYPDKGAGQSTVTPQDTSPPEGPMSKEPPRPSETAPTQSAGTPTAQTTGDEGAPPAGAKP